MSIPTDPPAIPDSLLRSVAQAIRAGREWCGHLKLYPTMKGENYPHTAERCLVAPTVALAESLRAISGAEITRLPVTTRAAIRRLRELFTGIVVDLWGWGFVVQDDAAQYMADRLDWHRKTIIEPLQSASLAILDADEGDVSPRIRDDALSAEHILCVPPMPIDEARTRYPQLLEQYETALIFGSAVPNWKPQDVEAIEQALGDASFGIGTPLMKLAFQEGRVRYVPERTTEPEAKPPAMPHSGSKRPGHPAEPPAGQIQGDEAADDNGSHNQVASRRRNHRNPGEARALVIAALEELSEGEELGLNKLQIISKYNIVSSTFYRLLDDDDEAKKLFAKYHRKSMGRGPARLNDF